MTGAACLVRFNGIFLVPPFLLAILFLDVFGVGWRKRLELAALLLAVTLITVAPWLYLNYRHNGSPFHNTTYLIVALALLQRSRRGWTDQDGMRVLSGVFHSLGDVLRYDPWRILLTVSGECVGERAAQPGGRSGQPAGRGTGAGGRDVGPGPAPFERSSPGALRRCVLRPAPRIDSLGSALLPVRRRDLRWPGLVCP